MGNINNQSPIQLAGPGFAFKLKGNYRPGEYRQLCNAEIDDQGSIVNRRNISLAGFYGRSTLDNSFGFVGQINGRTIVASETEQLSVDEDWVDVLWSPTSLSKPATGSNTIVGAFEYGGDFFWITHYYDTTVSPAVSTMEIYKRTDPPNAYPLGITYASLVKTNLITDYAHTYFVHKDRLWLIGEQSIYWSKATDPTIFAVPDGGFVNLPESKILHAMAINDSIYILADNGIYVFSYASDPNTDGYMRRISDVVCDNGVIHKNTPYGINNSGIFRIGNMDTEKVHDLPFDYEVVGKSPKLLSFEEYLVIIYRTSIRYKYGATASGDYLRGWKFPSFTYSYDSQYNVYFVNTLNGSTHVVDFYDCLDLTDDFRGRIVDAMVVSDRGGWFDMRVFFQTSRFISDDTVNDELLYNSAFYVMRSSRKNFFIRDQVLSSLEVEDNVKPRINIEFDQVVPDGSEYLIKKFRSLIGTAKLPYFDFGVQVSYNNGEVYGSKVEIVNVVADEGNPHFAFRIPLNQRGHAINIKFSTSNDEVSLAAYSNIYDQLEISDLRLVWSPTNRLPVNRTYLGGSG